MSGLPQFDPPARDGFELRLALYYGALLTATGIQVPFFPLWLDSKGLDPRAIGVVLAAPVVVRMIATPAVSRFSDRRGDTRDALIVTSLAAVACFALVGFANSFSTILLAVAVAAIFLSPIGALADAYALSGLEQRKRAYGTVRLWGSVAFLFANLLAGQLLSVIAVKYLIWIIVAALALMGALSLLLLPSAGRRKTSNAASRHLWLSPRFLVVAAAAALIQSSHGLYYGFSAIDWRSRGLGSGEVGFLWAIGIAAEIGFFAISGRLKLAPLALIGLGAGGALIRWIGLSFGPIGPELPLLQCLHALSFGATHLGSVQFAAAAAGRQQTATAQADFGLILALGGATATGFSGVLYAGMGDRGYLVMAAMAAVGGVLLVLSRRLSN